MSILWKKAQSFNPPSDLIIPCILKKSLHYLEERLSQFQDNHAIEEIREAYDSERYGRNLIQSRNAFRDMLPEKYRLQI